MRIIPFPLSDERTAAQKSFIAELEAALDGTGRGPRAEAWRELRAQVRHSVAPMEPEFEQRLRTRLSELQAHAAPKRRPRPAWLWHPRRLGLAASAASTAIAVLVVFGQEPSGPAPQTVSAPRSAPAIAARTQQRAEKEPAQAAAASGAGAQSASAPTFGTSSAASGRVQQLGASITLAAASGEVQETADRVSRLATGYGGFVQSSHVNVASSSGEANMTLSLPSAKLSAALTALANLAPVRAESQSLQDITGSYDAARQRLTEAMAEQRALLRALSKASTQDEIDSLHERLGQARGAVARARSSLQTISHEASSTEVEVSVLSNPHPSGEGLTLTRGLHDAANVLTVTLIVLLLAAAVLVPLALLVLALLSVRASWRRYQRERAL